MARIAHHTLRHHPWPARALALWSAPLLAALLTALLTVAVRAASLPRLEAGEECNTPPADDPYRPEGYVTYFADEFDCPALAPHWVIQGRQTVASYVPSVTGYVGQGNGILQVGVPGPDITFPYLYLVDESATTYDVPYTERRVDWLPNQGSFRLALRLRFRVEALGEHRISLYADGHRPAYAGPLFYVGMDYSDEDESWRGLILGADRGNRVVDLGEQGYPDPYTDWFVLTVDFDFDQDRFAMAVDGTEYLTAPLSSFKDADRAALRPDILYLGSLARLEKPAPWTDLELDWLRVYAPRSTPPAQSGLLSATVEPPPTPTDPVSPYVGQLPPGPFTNTPYWSEGFDEGPGDMPSYWQLLLDNDPAHSWTEVRDGRAWIRNRGLASAVPVWGLPDDLLPDHILSGPGPKPGPAASPLLQALGSRAHFPRFDWRPNRGNVRYAWKALQTANGYGVEVSNGGHAPLFTGAMFYTLLDTTANNGEGQFIFPSCQEQYFWRLHLLPGYDSQTDQETVITADYINGTVHLYVDGQEIGWWPESDCSLNWYLKGENATSPDLLFFGNPAVERPGSWSEVGVDWFATFPGLPRTPPPVRLQLAPASVPLSIVDAEGGLPVSATLQLMGPVTATIQWEARLSSVPSWLTVQPLTGTLEAVTGTGRTVLPPLTQALTITATRPMAHGVYSTTLVVRGVTEDGQPVAPAYVPIFLLYAEERHELYLPLVKADQPTTRCPRTKTCSTRFTPNQ